jgi:hypothetical protein
MPHHFLCLQPLANQGYIGNTCTTRSLQAALGSPRHFYPAFYHLLVAYTPVCSDKMLRLERLAAQDAHHLTAHVGVARRCHTRPQNSPTCRVQCSPKFGAFLVHPVGAAYRPGSWHTPHSRPYPQSSNFLMSFLQTFCLDGGPSRLSHPDCCLLWQKTSSTLERRLW